MTTRYKATLKGGNIRQNHLPLDELRAALPAGVVGSPNRKAGQGELITIRVGVMSFQTDVPEDKPNIFRNRSLARAYFEAYSVTEGDVIVYERTGPGAFSVRPEWNETSGGAAETPEQTERQRKMAEILARPEQARFRKQIASRDGWRCAITGCLEPQALEAAHLHPVSWGGSDDAANGILLRADIHRLFDAGLLVIDPTTGAVSVAASVDDSGYRSLSGIIISTGADLANLERRNA